MKQKIEIYYDNYKYEIPWIAIIPKLLEVQRVSFFSFLNSGFQQELQRRHVFFQTPNTELRFYPQRLRLEAPCRTYQETLRLAETYITRFFIPRSLYNRQKKYIRFEWILLGTLPLLTDQCHFLVQGSPRVCITQVVRGPGIYKGNKVEKDRTIFYVDLVPERGGWVRIEKDSENRNWITQRKEPKLPLWTVLKTMGLLCVSSSLSLFRLRSLQVSYTNQKEDYDDYDSIQVSSRKKQAKIIYLTRRFSSLRTYDLGKIGRQRLNQRFQQKLPICLRCLVPTDFLRVVNDLNQLADLSFDRLDDVDSLVTRRLRAVGDLFRLERTNALVRLERRVVERLDFFAQNPSSIRLRAVGDLFRLESLTPLIPTEPFNHCFRQFVTKHPLLQFADQLNPLSDLTQKRRVTGLGPDGLSISNRRVEFRTIHPSHFGRLCPVETPEGQNAGILNSPTLRSLCNRRHNYESSWRLFKSKLSKFSLVRRSVREGLTSGPEHRLALGPNLIPFMEHNDRNRVLMGASMLRQALPTRNVSAPRICTGIDLYARNDRGQSIRARWSGMVCFVSVQRILIQTQIPPGRVVRHHKQVEIIKRSRSRRVPLELLSGIVLGTLQVLSHLLFQGQFCLLRSLKRSATKCTGAPTRICHNVSGFFKLFSCFPFLSICFSQNHRNALLTGFQQSTQTIPHHGYQNPEDYQQI